MSGLYGAVPIGLDVNQLGAGGTPRLSITQPSPYLSALVEDVILNEEHPNYNDEGSNCGDVRVRVLPRDRNVPVEQLNWASPIDSSVEDYPLKHETVLVYFALGRLFYTRRINSTKKVGDSTWPGLSSVMGPQISGKQQSEAMLLAAEGITPYELNNATGNQIVTNVPNQNPNAIRLRACEGDTIIYGRYGNTIRMGSNLFTQNEEESEYPEPNIILTAGAHTPAEVSTDVKNMPRSIYSTMYENVNADSSCIWMVANQNVKFVPATAGSQSHLVSSKVENVGYTGAQIFINSNRVVLNSKVNEIALFSRQEINLSSIKSITLDTEHSVVMTANNEITLDAAGDIFIRGDTISFKANKDLAYKTSGNYSITGQKIFIGSYGDTTQPMVLGTKLAVFLQQLISALATNIPGFSNAGTAPAAAAALTPILLDLQTSLTNPLAAPFNSKDNFTSETNTV